MMFEPIFAYKILQLKFMDNLFVNTSILYFICIVSVIKKNLLSEYQVCTVCLIYVHAVRIVGTLPYSRRSYKVTRKKIFQQA